MNTIAITGRLTDNPELKTTQSGVSVCQYRLAVKRPKTKDTTDFLTVISWRQGAEYIAKYGHKGDMVAVTGVLTARNWEDRDGHKRTAYEVVSDTVELIGGRKEEPKPAVDIERMDTYTPHTATAQASNAQPQGVDVLYTDEELPF